jgi:hypothetical protein
MDQSVLEFMRNFEHLLRTGRVRGGQPEHLQLPPKGETETDCMALKLLRACCDDYFRAEKPILAFLHAPPDFQLPIVERMKDLVSNARLVVARATLLDDPPAPVIVIDLQEPSEDELDLDDPPRPVSLLRPLPSGDVDPRFSILEHTHARTVRLLKALEEQDPQRNDKLIGEQVRKVFLFAYSLGLARSAEVPDSPLSREEGKRKLDTLLPVLQQALAGPKVTADGEHLSASVAPVVVGSLKPGYPAPSAERLRFSEKRLAEIEQYIAPDSAVFASLLVRALLARTCSTAEAMWAIFWQLQSGRYKVTSLGECSASSIVSEGNAPAGLDVAKGVLHIDGTAGDWGLLVVTLPGANGNVPMAELTDTGGLAAPADLPLCPVCGSPPAAHDVDDVCPNCGAFHFRCGIATHVPLSMGPSESQVIHQQVRPPHWERIPPSQVVPRRPASTQCASPSNNPEPSEMDSPDLKAVLRFATELRESFRPTLRTETERDERFNATIWLKLLARELDPQKLPVKDLAFRGPASVRGALADLKDVCCVLGERWGLAGLWDGKRDAAKPPLEYDPPTKPVVEMLDSAIARLEREVGKANAPDEGPAMGPPAVPASGSQPRQLPQPEPLPRPEPQPRKAILGAPILPPLGTLQQTVNLQADYVASVSGKTQRSLLQAVNGKGNVPILQVLREVYRDSDGKNLEALLKAKDRLNQKLAADHKNCELCRRGDTFVLAPL